MSELSAYGSAVAFVVALNAGTRATETTMSKRMAILIGAALVMAPGAASAQSGAGRDVGASFRIVRADAQPGVMAEAGPAVLQAAIPAGWAWSVSRGVGGGPGSASRLLASGLERSHSVVALPQDALAGSASTAAVTWTFSPI